MSNLSLMSDFKYLCDLSLMFNHKNLSYLKFNSKDMSDLSLMSNFTYMSHLSLMFNPKNLSNLINISIFMLDLKNFPKIEKISIFQARKLGSSLAR